MYQVRFWVHVEMLVAIHVKCWLLLPNLTKSGICGYVLVNSVSNFLKICTAVPELPASRFNSRHEADRCIFVCGRGMDVM